MHNPKLSRSQVFFVQIFSRVKMGNPLRIGQDIFGSSLIYSTQKTIPPYPACANIRAANTVLECGLQNA
jgi:hypothetical protein